jgi:putative glutamine amidotransferase
MTVRPTILVPCDVKQVGLHAFHCVGEKYIDAVAHGADAWPLLLPAFGAGQDLEPLTGHVDLRALLAGVDGVFLPGSASNVHPARYGGATPPLKPDVQRDELTFDLIDAALALRVPLFAVCRGLQELNVALGGTLHPAVHDVPGFMDHRENGDDPREQQYASAHPVRLTPGGRLHDLLGVDELAVNSLHGQGIRDLAPTLAVEATAPDGLVEAVSAPGHDGFLFGVQWHPEWAWRSNAASVALFRAFGEAARLRCSARVAAGSGDGNGGAGPIRTTFKRNE